MEVYPFLKRKEEKWVVDGIWGKGLGGEEQGREKM